MSSFAMRADAHGARLDWLWVRSRLLLVAPFPIAALTLAAAVVSGQFAADFRGGAWRAAHRILAGDSPFGPSTTSGLLAHPHAFVTPPPLALAVVPLVVLPFGIAAAVWTLANVCALCAGLYVVGVRSRGIYAFALLSFPLVLSIGNGQPDGIMALGLALVWRYRDQTPGAVAAGVVIAAKLLAWPLVLWMLVTRRTRSAFIAAGTAASVLLCSWAVVGFSGLCRYPALLSADARAWGVRSDSLLAAFGQLGANGGLATALATIAACAVVACALAISDRSDRAWFVGALALGLLASPMLRASYLLALVIPLAAARKRLDAAWLLLVPLWFSAPGVLPDGVGIGLVLVATCGIALLVSRGFAEGGDPFPSPVSVR